MLIDRLFDRFPQATPRRGVLHVGAQLREEGGLYRSTGMDPDDIRSVLWIDANEDAVRRQAEAGVTNIVHAVVSGEDDAVVSFHVTNNAQSSSILPLHEHLVEHPDVRVVQVREVTTVTLDTLIVKRLGLCVDAYDFVNLEIQGAELLALRGAAKLLVHVNAVYLKVNTKELYKGCAMLEEVEAFMVAAGFDRAALVLTTHGWGDALYVRRRPFQRGPRERPAVTFAQLGRMGRLGNQMFQIAAAVVYARKFSCDARLPPWKYAEVLIGDEVLRKSLFAEQEHERIADSIAMESRTLDFEETDASVLRAIKASDRGRVSLSGYFQNPRFFSGTFDDEAYIRKLFTPPRFVEAAVTQRFAWLKSRAGVDNNARVCAVHVRRGDYVGQPERHPVLPVSYYRAALDVLERSRRDDPRPDVYLVFSDDVTWCEENLIGGTHLLPRERSVMVKDSADFADLLTMARCHDFVIANSSFSWWGAWLAQDPTKRVVAPMPHGAWYGPELAHLDTRGLLPATWTTVSTL
jgi:FkbM family methyltransferase